MFLPPKYKSWVKEGVVPSYTMTCFKYSEIENLFRELGPTHHGIHSPYCEHGATGSQNITIFHFQLKIILYLLLVEE